MAKATEYELKITSAVLLDGAIVKPGATVKVGRVLARNLLDRGKAEMAAGQSVPDKGAGPIGTDGKGGAKRQGKKPADEAPEE